MHEYLLFEYFNCLYIFDFYFIFYSATYFLFLNIKEVSFYDYIVGERILSILAFFMLVSVLLNINTFSTLRIDIEDNSVSESEMNVFGVRTKSSPLERPRAVVIRRRPTFFRARMYLKTARDTFPLGPSGFLPRRHQEVAREVADLLGVPITDERGHIIPYPV